MKVLNNLVSNIFYMVHMRQPFFSIVSALVYLSGALLLAAVAGSQSPLTIGGAVLNDGALWSISGLFFLMAYFSLVHLKDK
jgi:hypothetical protein